MAADSHIDTLAGWLAGSTNAVAFTGAGISTESGIPDFRSPGGVWAKSTPVYFDEFLRSAEARKEAWRQKSLTHVEFVRAAPNDGHVALAKWETEGRLKGVITQNIDGLHQIAGSRCVLELHGTARAIACLGCGARYDAEPMVRVFNATGTPPDCPRCDGLLKHATISFGQSLPENVLAESVRLAETSDLCLAIGSSLVVYPAASIPELAKERGARLVIINRTETPLDGIADLVIREPIGATLRGVMERLA